MKISLKDVSASKTSQLCFDYTIDLSGEEINFDFPLKKPVSVSGEITDIAGVIHLDGEIAAQVSCRCARCNKPIEQTKYVDFSFILARTPISQESDDILVVETDSVELDDIVVPELILNMDMTLICDENCKGLCQKCGQNLNDGDCACPKKQIDPRLEKLAQLLKKDY